MKRLSLAECIAFSEGVFLSWKGKTYCGFSGLEQYDSQGRFELSDTQQNQKLFLDLYLPLDDLADRGRNAMKAR